MKNIIIAFILILLINISCKDINKFSAGSYPYAETYEVNLTKEQVIEKVKKIKDVDANLQVPPFKWAGNTIILKDENSKNNYFSFYIYLKERNQIIFFYVVSDNAKSIVGLISVHNGLSLGNWREINKDLSDEENKAIKEEFEKKIINKINK